MFSSGPTMLPLRAKGHLTIIPTLLTSVVQETPQTLQTIVIDLGCPLKAEGKALLLKIPCTLGTGPWAPHHHPWLGLAWKPPPWGLPFSVQKAPCRVSKEKATHSPTQLRHPWTKNNIHHGTITLQVQRGNTHLDRKQELSNGTSDPFT